MEVTYQSTHAKTIFFLIQNAQTATKRSGWENGFFAELVLCEQKLVSNVRKVLDVLDRTFKAQ